MFTVTHDSRTHSYQSSCPELQCLRATDTSRLTHQIADSSSHSFYAACSRWQIKLRIFPVRSKLIGPSQKLPDRHAHHARPHWFLNELLQPVENRFQAWTVRHFQRLAGEPVKNLSHRSAHQFAFASSSASLQLADEMELTQLYDPALLRSQSNDPPNVVGNRSADTSGYPSGNRHEYLRPALYVLPARQKYRIEENRSILTARLYCHQIQHPMLSSKPKIQSIENQNQRPCWKTQNTSLGDEVLYSAMKTITQRSSRKVASRSERFQSPSSKQHRSQKLGRRSPTLATAFFLADSPRTLATAALPTSGTESIDFYSATWRFRVRRIHARELATPSRSKYGKSQANYF
jgi:hypothetical protein